MIELLQAHTWLMLIAIFLSRVADQTLDTLRAISIVRGYKVMAVFMGFLVVLIWINVAAQVLDNLHARWYLGLVYAAGFAAGQATGMWLEGRIALGHQLVRIISRRDVDMAPKLWAHGYPVTELEGKGKSGLIDVIFVVERRPKVPALVKLIEQVDPEAFYTVEDVKRVGLKRPPKEPWYLPVWSEIVDVVEKGLDLTGLSPADKKVDQDRKREQGRIE